MPTVVNIGGSVIAPSSGDERFEEYAEALSSVDGELYVVVGGGGAARDYIGIARRLGANEAVCDEIGIDVTRLNARLLISALNGSAYPEPPSGYEDAKAAMALGRIVVMGGVAPGQSTDAVSAVLAEYVDADRLVFATSVPGIFREDPRVDDSAEFVDEITPSELVELVMKIELKAGSKSPVDPLAAKIIERSRLSARVVGGDEPGNVLEAIRGGAAGGTLIAR
ncbi:MAG: Uridylate kinase [Methanonatronarchaeales archaeon]|nr:Uridylate kinase [Methanonatronarchaeales archaeon]